MFTDKITKISTKSYFKTSSNESKIQSSTKINDIEEPSKTTIKLPTTKIITAKQKSTQNKLVTTKITDLVKTSFIGKMNLKSSNNILRNRVKTEKINSENNIFVWITAVLSVIIAVFVLMTIVKKLVKNIIFLNTSLV